MIAFRKRHKILGASRFWRDRIVWRGVAAEPDRSHNSHTLAFLLEESSHLSLYVIANAYSESLSFELPSGYDWSRVIDTSLPSPSDIAEGGEELALPQAEQIYFTAARSVVVLEGQRKEL